MHHPHRHTPPLLPLFLLSVLLPLLLLPLAARAQVVPLNSTDVNGCRLGSEFRLGKCRLCRPGFYRFLVPAPDARPSWIRLPEQAPFLCPEEYSDYDLTTEPSSPESCVPCPAGTYYPFFGAQSAELCIACPAGTTSLPGARRCTPCPRGKTSAHGSAVCVRCRRGSYVTKPCFRGRLPMGTGCMKCPKGYYASSVNAERCMKCPTGTSTRFVGAKWKGMCKKCGTHGVKCSCADTEEGHNNNQATKTVTSSYRPVGADVCINCPSGARTFTPFAILKKQCFPCPSGTLFSADKGCTPCPMGLHSFGRGASACRMKWTDACPSGSFKSSRGVCQTCRPGYRYNAANRVCERCPPGSVSGGGLQQSCTACAAPEVAPANGVGPCACGRNYFRERSGMKRCVMCEDGTKKDKEVHNDGSCEPDCEVMPEQRGCKNGCPNGFGRDIRSGGGPCEKCGMGLKSPEGERYCRHPRTGCPVADEVRALALSRFGFYLVCAGPDTETLF